MKNRYIFLIFAALVVFIVGGILAAVKLEIYNGETELTCPQWYESIERTFEVANFCERDDDCKSIKLGGPYVEFGCFKFVNISTDEEKLLREVDKYDQRCSRAINYCFPSPRAVCSSKKCVSVEEEDLEK